MEKGQEDIKINVVVSETDKLCAFEGDFFEPVDAEQMVEFVKKMGYRSELIKTDKKFSDYWNPFRKIMHRDIQWSDPRVIYNVIKWRKEGKSHDDIAELLHSESTGFAVFLQLGKIWEAYNLWRDTAVGDITDEQLMEFCKSFAKNRR
jgi:hypothetical protein